MLALLRPAGFILVGGPSMMRPKAASAQPQPLEELQLSADKSSQILENMWEAQDTKNIIEAAASDPEVNGAAVVALRASAQGRATELIGAAVTVGDPDPEAQIKRTRLEGGIERTLAIYYNKESSHFICHVDNSEPIDGISTSSIAIRLHGWDQANQRPEFFDVLSSSYNGYVPRILEGDEIETMSGGDPCGGCNSNCVNRGQELRGECKTQGVVGCVLGAGSCVMCVACLGTVLCLGCVLLSCGGAVLSCCGDSRNETCRECRRVC